MPSVYDRLRPSPSGTLRERPTPTAHATAPFISPDLLAWLEGKFPLSSYKYCEDERGLYKEHGRREVLDLLRHTADAQKDTPL